MNSIHRYCLPLLAVCLLAPAAMAKTKPKAPDVSVSHGQMTDPRDGTTYNTVTIGTQTWMAENLDYRTGISWCYGELSANCEKYGRLYDWQTARTACPGGWHLPSDGEWSQLEDAIGGGANGDVGTKLKSKSMNGADAYGFTVLPAGGRLYDGVFDDVGGYARFWSASENGGANAWYRNFGNGHANVGRSYYDKSFGFSVRCLEN